MWRVIFSFRVRDDVAEAAAWYEDRQAGLGQTFVNEVMQVWREIAKNPLLAARKHPTKNLRWRYPPRFPYRIIYEVNEADRKVVVIAVVHAARGNSAD